MILSKMLLSTYIVKSLYHNNNCTMMACFIKMYILLMTDTLTLSDRIGNYL